jgi:hypothetical protein
MVSTPLLDEDTPQIPDFYLEHATSTGSLGSLKDAQSLITQIEQMKKQSFREPKKP